MKAGPPQVATWGFFFMSKVFFVVDGFNFYHSTIKADRDFQQDPAFDLVSIQ